MEYTVVYYEGSISKADEAINTLKKKVNALIKQGWKPQGGICAHGNTSLFLYQAMVK